jgi:hypothetical protein
MRIRKLIWGLLLLISCSKPSALPDAAVFLSVREAVTKVTDASYERESAVTRWTVFVFDTGNGWYRYASSEDAAPLSFSLRAGRRYACLALVNPPLSLNPETVASADDIRGMTARLEDESPGCLQMYGECLLLPSSGTQRQEILVKRLSSRLELRGVNVDFSAWPAWAGKTLQLRHIYVTNAYRTTAYGEDYASVSPLRSAWYNTLGWHAGESASAALDALLGERNLNAAIDADHPYTLCHTFYLYPNPVDEDSRLTSAWTPRFTRLVLEAEVDGETYYYPADVPAMHRNQACSVSSVVIRGPGSSTPEGAALTSDVFSVSWDGGEHIILE